MVPNEERLFLWKKLRNDFKEFSLEEQLQALAKFCAEMPFGARTLDYYNPIDWPTPWEILFHASFCTSSISLLMFYTLILMQMDAKVELYLVEDSDGIFLLPIIDNQFVLNYELGKVSKYLDIIDNFTVLQRYQAEQIKAII